MLVRFLSCAVNTSGLVAPKLQTRTLLASGHCVCRLLSLAPACCQPEASLLGLVGPKFCKSMPAWASPSGHLDNNYFWSLHRLTYEYLCAESARLALPWRLRGRTVQLTICGTVQLFFDFLLHLHKLSTFFVANIYRFFGGDHFFFSA